MIEINRDPIHIGLHIHKCAGTSLQIHFLACDRDGTSFWHTNPVVNYERSRPELEEINTFSRRMLKIIWGHEVHDFFLSLFPYRPTFLFTFLREPVSRLVSWYNYDARTYLELYGELKEFPDFSRYASQKQNHMCHFILRRFPKLVNGDASTLHEKAISVLEKFAFVGLQEDFQTGVNHLLQTLKHQPFPQQLKKNVTENRIEFDYLEAEIRQMNESDCLLYQYALERYKHSNRPDLNRIFLPESVGILPQQAHSDIYADFINRRVTTLTEDIAMNRYLPEYRQDNLRKLLLLLVRQLSAEDMPQRKLVYRDLLLELTSKLDISINKQDILDM